MFAFRDVAEGEVEGSPAVDLAFTDRHAPEGDLGLSVAGTTAGAATSSGALALLAREFTPEAPQSPLVGMRQVHSADVAVIDESYDASEVVADALVTRQPGVTLLVRAADCVPVLLASADNSVVAAVHSGRVGLVAGVVPAAIDSMRELGATGIRAWVGPHVCGSCYEVPAEMRDEVISTVPAAFGETSWGTPSVDVGAGVRAQLDAAGIVVHDVSRCTFESDELWSYRRDGQAAGRLGGLIRIRP